MSEEYIINCCEKMQHILNIGQFVIDIKYQDSSVLACHALLEYDALSIDFCPFCGQKINIQKRK